jgi:hypothetical protein
LARAGNERGFVFNPKDVKEGGVTGAVEGFAGSPKLNAALSNKNMKPTTQLINEELGLKSNPKSPTPLNRTALEIHIKKQGEAYQALNDIDNVFSDTAFIGDFEAAVGNIKQLALEIPEFAPSKALQKRIAALDPASGNFTFSGTTSNQIIKRLRQDANKAFKKGDSIEGFAFRDLGVAFEKMVERNLEKVGKGDIVSNMQTARTNIAKTYSVLDALGKRSAINADKLVAQRAAGRQLSGNLDFIADLAEQFPEQMRNVSSPAAFSEFEGLAAVSGAGAGVALSPAAFALPALIASKPLVRGGIASNFGQRLNFPGPGHPGILPGLIATGALQQQGLLEPPSVFNQ